MVEQLTLNQLIKVRFLVGAQNKNRERALYFYFVQGIEPKPHPDLVGAPDNSLDNNH